MQGSYKNNGLPRPYYMKPSKKGSVYDKMPKQIFLTNSRKLTGYIGMLFLFGLCVFLVSQEFKTPSDASYELVGADQNNRPGKNSGDIGKLVDSANAGDLENDRADLAMNKAQNSKGEYGHGISEAPKGGMVNEAPIVGNDEDLIIDGKTRKKIQGSTSGSKGKDFKAERGDDASREEKNLGSQADEKSEVGLSGQNNDMNSQKFPKKLRDVTEILEESDK